MLFCPFLRPEIGPTIVKFAIQVWALDILSNSSFFLLRDVVQSYKFTFFLFGNIFPILLNFSYILAYSLYDASVINPKHFSRFSDRILCRDSEFFEFSRIFPDFGIFSEFSNSLIFSIIFLKWVYFPVFPDFFQTFQMYNFLFL